MLKRTYEWLRVVDPNPDNATVESRSKSVGELLGRLDQAKDRGLLGTFLTAAVAGFDGRFEPDAPQIATVVEAIRKYQPAFPSDLSENALELRITCALTVGELLARGPKKGREAERLVAAMLILTGVGVRPADEGKHLRELAAELAGEAEKVVRGEAFEKRTCPALDLAALETLDPQGDVPTFWKSLLPILRDCFEVAELRSRADREELEVLWWFYNAYSETLSKPLASLPGDVALLACGAEVADRVLLPPHPGVSEMVADAVLRNRKRPELSARSFGTLVAAWDEPSRKLLVPANEASRWIALAFPALLPLTWLSVRHTESRGAGGWEGEFQQKTGIIPTQETALAVLAKQAFLERAAQRLIAEGGGA